MKHKGVIIFDLDDCLLMTVQWYNAGWLMFREVMVKLGFGKYSDELIDKLNEFDAAGVEVHGFRKERFGQAMVETYEYYCDLENIEPDEDTAAGILDIGMTVYRHRPVLYPGAREMLASLRDSGYELHCVTKGDRCVQEEKLTESGIVEFFNQVHCVPLNKKDAIESIMASHPDIPPENMYFVGNSMKDDMRPAVELGINAILVYEYTWHFDEAEFKGMDRVKKLDRLAQLAEFLEQGHLAEEQ